MKIKSLIVNIIALAFVIIGFLNSDKLIEEIITGSIKENLSTQIKILDEKKQNLIAKRATIQEEEIKLGIFPNLIKPKFQNELDNSMDVYANQHSNKSINDPKIETDSILIPSEYKNHDFNILDLNKEIEENLKSNLNNKTQYQKTKFELWTEKGLNQK